jgi:glycosyltransferase involved in cell wall biosynthesis
VKLIICHIITSFHEKAASVRRTLEVCISLVSQGYTVYLIVGNDSSIELMESVSRKGINIIRLDSLVKEIDLYKDFKTLLRLINLLRRLKCNIVHTHLSKDGILGRLAAKAVKTKIICHTVHGPTAVHNELSFIRKKVYLFVERFVAKFTTSIIVVGKEIQEKYCRLKIGSIDKYRLIYTGRNFSKFLAVKQTSIEDRIDLRKSLGIAIDDIVVGYVARIAPFKGHEYAINSCEELSKKYNNIKFLFIGSANIPSRNAFEAKIKKNVIDRGLENNILFLDHKYDIERYYSIFDIFILPSLSEGLPNVILEAAVMELPIVAFDCGGVKEILGDNEFIVQTKDAISFTLKLEELIQSKDIMISAAKNRKYDIGHLLATWDIEKMINDKCNLYKELLN